MFKKKRTISPEQLAAMKAGREKAKTAVELARLEAEKEQRHAERVAAAENLVRKIKSPSDEDDALFRRKRGHRRYHKTK